jgi:hypothetical protein
MRSHVAPGQSLEILVGSDMTEQVGESNSELAALVCSHGRGDPVDAQDGQRLQVNAECPGVPTSGTRGHRRKGLHGSLLLTRPLRKLLSAADSTWSSRYFVLPHVASIRCGRSSFSRSCACACASSRVTNLPRLNISREREKRLFADEGVEAVGVSLPG